MPAEGHETGLDSVSPQSFANGRGLRHSWKSQHLQPDDVRLQREYTFSLPCVLREAVAIVMWYYITKLEVLYYRKIKILILLG